MLLPPHAPSWGGSRSFLPAAARRLLRDAHLGAAHPAVTVGDEVAGRVLLARALGDLRRPPPPRPHEGRVEPGGHRADPLAEHHGGGAVVLVDENGVLTVGHQLPADGADAGGEPGGGAEVVAVDAGQGAAADGVGHLVGGGALVRVAAARESGEGPLGAHVEAGVDQLGGRQRLGVARGGGGEVGLRRRCGRRTCVRGGLGLGRERLEQRPGAPGPSVAGPSVVGRRGAGASVAGSGCEQLVQPQSPPAAQARCTPEAGPPASIPATAALPARRCRARRASGPMPEGVDRARVDVRGDGAVRSASAVAAPIGRP